MTATTDTHSDTGTSDLSDAPIKGAARFRGAFAALSGLRPSRARAAVDSALAPAPPGRPINATNAHRNLLNTPEGVWAYYALAGVDWAMRAVEARQTVMTEQMFRLADQIGHTMWVRCLSSPFPYRDFAQRLYDDTPHPITPAPGTSSFADYVDAAQLHTIAFGARRQVAIVGVLLEGHTIKDADLPKLFQEVPLPPNQGLIERARRELRAVTTAMARPGYNAKPLTPRELRWVIHASLGMGAPIPPAIIGDHDTAWNETTTASFTGPVRSLDRPDGLTTQVRVIRDSREYVTEVAVLHADDFGDRDTDDPNLAPFMAWADTRPYPVDVCAVFRVRDGRDMTKAAELNHRKAKNIAGHYMEHGDEPPAAVVRGIERARQVEDAVANGSREVACRVEGVVMFAVTGATEEECLENANALRVDAAREQHITLTHDYGQWRSYRSFVPGEPCLMTGHVTRQPASFAATAVPNVSSAAGDRTGFLIGNVAGSSDLLVFDPFGGPKRNLSGMWAVGADPGSGKSYLMGAVLDHCARRGIPTVGYDPSGPWARLCDVPHLKGNARHLSLTSAH